MAGQKIAFRYLVMTVMLLSAVMFGCDNNGTSGPGQQAPVQANPAAGAAEPADPGAQGGQEPSSQQDDADALPAQAEQEAPAAQPEPEEEQTFSLGYDLADIETFMAGMDYIIGANAPAADVMTVNNLNTLLISRGVETGSAKLSDEVEDYKKDNYIIIGSPCDNPVAAEIFSSEIADKGDCKIFPAGEGVIKIKAVSNNHFWLYIGGNTAEDTKKAAEAIKYPSQYGLSGTEARVTGAIDDLTVNAVG